MGYNWSIVEDNVFNPRFGSMGAAELKKILFAVYVSGSSDCDDYSLGRKLGLTDRQVRNYRVGSNLLLDSMEQTEAVVRESLLRAIRSSQIEYQETKNRVSVQIDSQVAFDYLSARLKQEGVFRDCDASNGHVSLPVDRFFRLIMLVFPEFDETAAKAKLSELAPEFEDQMKGVPENKFSEKLSEWLSVAESATTIAANLVPCVQTGLMACGVL